MRNLLMTVSYDGTNYFGFQTQPGGNTVQDHIEEAIRQLTGEQLKIHGSGRTDAGVHARQQPFHFHTASQIPVERWCLALNGRLPSDIRVLTAREVPLDFHSRRSAKRKTYRYTINANRITDVFQRNYQFHHPGKLNIEAMQQSLPFLLGTHDYTSFASRHSTKASHVRTIYDARMIVDSSANVAGTTGQGILHLYVTGNGFLQHMVRIIVGTLLEIGEGKRTPVSMKTILEAKDRKAAGPTAESKGLMLWSVEYDEISG
ncbi:tRNA pseudouridine(38-40) synthase TruA [Paenibacillus sp. DXFW5]|uniref:tRNA pseudouridine synthase A n=1 Tax=Paenibacillus rhizolycopersici TaxID=2780073 RepID=A0ABS2HCQ7_9BACL|nr:tRNA pseudouridine(38-40) synthase TruA [Paenibacillus rhizolycopersici]MBM6997859.1 tRNA pseudouridine(38-40) synthase TruA [Paenibacillus rhizolycopersici]